MCAGKRERECQVIEDWTRTMYANGMRDEGLKKARRTKSAYKNEKWKCK